MISTVVINQNKTCIYRKAIKMLLIAGFFLVSAMKCTINSPLTYAEQMDIMIKPDPIIVENGSAQFNFSMKLPPGRWLAKIDSIKSEFSTHPNDNTIANSVVLVPENWDRVSGLSFEEKIELSDLAVQHGDTLYCRVLFFKKERSKSTYALPVSYFVSN